MSSGLFELSKNIWTKITTADKNGKVLHISGEPSVVYVLSATQPVGYNASTPTYSVTTPRNFFMYEGIKDDEFLWAYSINDSAIISVTPNVGMSLNTDDEYFNNTRAMTVQSYTEGNSKQGLQHEYAVYIPDFVGLSVSKTIFKTGDKPVILKARLASYTGDGLVLGINQDAIYTGGTPASSYNATTINPVAPVAGFIVGATITNDGTKIFADEYLIGNTSIQGKGGTLQIAGRERILKPNTTFLFYTTSLDTQPQDIAFFDSWYEGDLDLPR